MPRKPSTVKCDVIVIGAGPAGLSFARALAETGVKTVVLEQLPAKTLANPPIDGRDIALTHLSYEILQKLDVWQRIDAGGVSVIKEAKVLNGASPYVLGFHHEDAGEDNLGWLVPNHLIRKAVYESVKGHKTVRIINNVSAEEMKVTDEGAVVVLSDGRRVKGALIVAADSRFSGARRKMGISASMHDFGRVCIVCEMEHELPHDDTAYECFHFGRTLAVLPLNGNMCSVVITLSADQADVVMEMNEEEFNADIQERFENRLGEMKLVGKRHPYPLMGVYARAFVANRFALVGDAAVGMHPVTAHGFNLGLRGANTLAEEIKSAQSLGLDIGSATVLRNYQSKHRRVSRPLYLGTNFLVKLYTDDRLPAKIARRAMLRLGNRLPPVKRAIMNQLTEIKSLSG